VHSPSHTIDLDYRSRQNIYVDLRENARSLATKDFILEYGVNDADISSGVITGNRDNEQFFLCQIEAPEMSCEPEISPREYIFIVDVSGSMNGFPLDVSKQLLRNLLNQLTPQDRFNILFFAGGSNMLSEQSLTVNRENLSYALKAIDGQVGGGGTHMLTAIKNAMKYPKDKGYSRSFVIVTDGYVTVEEAAMEYIQDHLADANFYAFGIGSSVNRYLIEAIAHVGRSEPFVVLNQKESKAIAQDFQKYIQYPVLTDIRIEADGIDVYDIIPERIPDLTAGRPIYFFGKYTGKEGGTLTVTGNQSGKTFKDKVQINGRSDFMTAIPYLWAREKIRLLDDFNAASVSADRVDKITKLGLDYNLLTKYTSFIAIDEKVIENAKKSTTVRQATPLPQGVSNMAVGFSLDIPDMLSDGTATIHYDIDVVGSDKTLEVLFDIILAEDKEMLDKLNWSELAGQTLRVVISDKGIELLSDQDKNVILWLENAYKELLKMGWNMSVKNELKIFIQKSQ